MPSNKYSEFKRGLFYEKCSFRPLSNPPNWSNKLHISRWLILLETRISRILLHFMNEAFFRPNESSNSKRSSEVVRCYKVKEQRANLVEHVVVLITDKSIRQLCANPSLFLCFYSSPLRFLWCWHDGRSAISTGESWVGNSRTRCWSNFPRKNHWKETIGWPGRWIPSHVEPGKDVSWIVKVFACLDCSWNF